VQRRLLAATVGDIRDLSRFKAGYFDAALCLSGPLTHISDEPDRVQAVRELVRVARPGALVAVSVMGKLAALRTTMAHFQDMILEPPFDELATYGNTMMRSMGTMWHFFRADELRELAEACGLETVEMVGCQGLSTNLADATNRLAEDHAMWQIWRELLLETSTETALVDVSEHMLYLSRVPVR
jgi:SAM-dependent methyltransferase